MTFSQFGLHPKVESGVSAAGYETPTPIQQQTIPAALAGRDVLGLAQTGTGKTAAFVLPILNRLLDGPRRVTRALVVAPTRELAEQINGEVRTLGKSTGLRSTTIYGGVGKGPQLAALRSGVEIVVACPGRLLDHMSTGHASLAHIEVLVLDEADHMFDMGFLPSVRRILRQVPDSAQRLLFSATMPVELNDLAGSALHDPLRVEVDRQAPAETVDHALYPVAKSQKLDLLKHILRRDDSRSALVFTRTKHGAKRLAQQLDRENYFVAALQGNMSQNQRSQALDGFRDGKFHILVATDIAARGIDVTRVSHVVNFDVPSTGDAYTHRIGRTGRAQRTGLAYTFATEEDDKAVRGIERELGARLERRQIDGFDYLPIPQSESGRERSDGGRDRSGRTAGGRRSGAAGGRKDGSGGRGAGTGEHNGARRNGAAGGRGGSARVSDGETGGPAGTRSSSSGRSNGDAGNGNRASRATQGERGAGEGRGRKGAGRRRGGQSNRARATGGRSEKGNDRK